MKKLFFILTVIVLSSCVENTKKYKDLVSRIDSLETAKSAQNREIEEAFEIINQIESGLKEIRETENILKVRSQSSGELTNGTKEQIIEDINSISQAIIGYKNQIENLKKENRFQSNQFRIRLENLQKELAEKSRIIEELTTLLEEKDIQIRIKTKQISSLDKAVSELRGDVESLSKEKELHKETISSQEKLLNTAFYIVGNKSELINAKVLTRGGLFRSARISYDAEQSSFIRIDIRETVRIALNSQKAKILSIHPTGSYTLEKDGNDMLSLFISNPDSFWEQTKYLVIQIQ